MLKKKKKSNNAMQSPFLSQIKLKEINFVLIFLLQLEQPNPNTTLEGKKGKTEIRKQGKLEILGTTTEIKGKLRQLKESKTEK